ncbi:MAG TPA: hypothetical protein PK779_13980, partial [Niabella sp.]|nr:hypothetical protein [Niabella sp.]
MRKMIFIFTAMLCFSQGSQALVEDSSFLQPASEKSVFHSSLKDAVPSKVVVDFNEVVYVLTNKGVGRIFQNKVIKDLRYRPLQNSIPKDIAIQDGTGFLYYLYDDVLLTNEEAGEIHFTLPKGHFSSFLISKNKTVLLNGDEKTMILENGKWVELSRPSIGFTNIYIDKGVFFAINKDAVYVIKNKKFEVLHQSKGLQALGFKGNEIVVGTANGYYGINRADGKKTVELKTKIPIQDISFLASLNNKIWAATPQGAFMDRGNGGYDYYASKRWLLEDKIIGVTKGNNGEIYFLSKNGVSKISPKKYTYHSKATAFQDKIRQRHIRYGLLAELRLASPGDLTTAELVDTDNDGLWSSFYLGSQAFRYAVTGEKIARDYTWETFAAYERLISINPLKGFPSRTYERKG